MVLSDDVVKHHRPWGFYQVLHSCRDKSFAVKKLVVQQGQRLSLQYHTQRSEHWYVLQGHGVAIVNDTHVDLTTGVSVDVPCGAIHRLMADASSDYPLVVIEIQIGALLSEEDIVRVEDDYGRCD